MFWLFLLLLLYKIFLFNFSVSNCGKLLFDFCCAAGEITFKDKQQQQQKQLKYTQMIEATKRKTLPWEQKELKINQY